MATLGWIIETEQADDLNLGLPSRIGWGQTLDEARTMTARMANVVDVDTDLAALKEGMHSPVRWRLLDEDGHVYYTGVVECSWVTGDNVDGEDYAYHILKFGEADVGATDVQFNAADLPGSFVVTHRQIRCVVRDGDDEWVITYG